jgi:hypothetical protein
MTDYTLVQKDIAEKIFEDIETHLNNLFYANIYEDIGIYKANWKTLKEKYGITEQTPESE